MRMEYAGLNNPIYSFRLTAVTCSPLFTSTGMSFPFREIQDKEESRMSKDIIRPFEEKMVSSALLEIP